VIREESMNLFIKGFDSSLHHRLKVLAAQRQITLKRLVELLLSKALLKGKNGKT
jgi:hypothetical protein